MKRVLTLVIILCCTSIALSAQSFDDEHIGSTTQVNFSGEKPIITDFFRSYAEWCKANPEEDNEINNGLIKDAYSYVCLNTPAHTYNGKVFDTKTVDTKNGYIKYDNGDTPSYYIECCYWNTGDRKKILFAANYVFDAMNTPNTMRLDFFEYDPQNHEMRKLLPPTDILYNSQEWNNLYAPTEMRNTRFNLPQKGKNITASISGWNEQEEKISRTDTLKWNGAIFHCQINLPDAAYNLPIEGKIVQRMLYTDKTGSHCIVLTQWEDEYIGRGGARILDGNLRAYDYLINREPVLFWKLQDWQKGCEEYMSLDAKFVENSLRVTDLDNNGISEVWIMYRLRCAGDVTPATMKLIMHQGKSKYSLRGRTRAIDEGGEYSMDETFETLPRAISEYAVNLLNEYITGYSQVPDHFFEK